MQRASVLFGLVLVLSTSARAATPPVSVIVEPGAGSYRVTDRATGWTLGGTIAPIAGRVNVIGGRDRIGSYQETSFAWPGQPCLAVIRSYEDRRAVLFRLHYSAQDGPVQFPSFSVLPAGLKAFSFQERNFAPYQFKASKGSSPILLFDQSARALVMSPASNFMVASIGPQFGGIGSGLNRQVTTVPEGLDQDTLVVFGDGIGATWDAWGATMRTMFGRTEKWVEQDPVVTNFGYWTDNGADYYYNYDLGKGYAETLRELVSRYRDEEIPIGYLQLDSWWYDKTTDDPTGKPGGATKNSKLPAGMWNRYGGIWEYRADRDLFPDGLATFDSEVRVPLVVHNRWMDRNSPYHQKYKISGIATIDPAWWSDTAEYLKGSGVTCYEQDWLDRIYDNSPELSSVLGVGDAFTDSMAKACADHGLTMQYCMALPRFFLQGVKYPNLTTIRTSDDRFEPRKWSDFLFTSQLADALGIRPWCDVFMSGETGNMILSVLSAGPVGTGDRIGNEDKANILMACRPDGLIVKPDRPIVPADSAYLDPTGPMLASTYTLHGDLKTLYLFAFSGKSPTSVARFKLGDLGVKGRLYLLDREGGTGRFVDDATSIETETSPQGFSYLEAAPASKCGVALIGDSDKFVGTGKQRIPSIVDSPSGLTVTVSFAKGEGPVRLIGASPTRPRARGRTGSANLEGYQAESGRFSVRVAPRPGTTTAVLTISPSR